MEEETKFIGLTDIEIKYLISCIDFTSKCIDNSIAEDETIPLAKKAVLSLGLSELRVIKTKLTDD